MCSAALTLCGMNPNNVGRFQTRKEPVIFHIDDDAFMCVREIPAGTLVDLVKHQAELSTSTDRARQLDLIMQIVGEFMLPEALQKFERRLHDKDNPIPLRTVIEVMRWLLGDVYGLRPTQSPSSSPDESSEETAGGISTDGAPPAESTLEPSPGTASST